MADAGTDFARLREAWMRYQSTKDEASRVLLTDLMKQYGIAYSDLAVSATDPSRWAQIEQNMRTQSVTQTGPRAQPQAPEQTQQDPNEVERQNLTKWMTEFTQSLGRPLDMNDPVFASLSKLGAARASMGVGASGVRVGRGGIGELGIQQGAMNAALPYAQQRQQMYQQGLGALDQRDRGIESLRQNAYGLNLQQQQMQNMVNQQMYGQQADSAGGTGGVVGGALGALTGIGATIATGGAAAGAIPGLISGGSKIGAGAGMGSVRRPTYSAPRPYGSFGNRGGGS